MLNLICVGTGRDGTTSLSQMVQHIFDQEGLGRKVEHEWESVNLYNEYCDFVESGNPSHLDSIRKIIINCPFDCIVGNGYAPILPIFLEVLGGKVGLVHLRRRDRDACVSSLVRNSELFPTNHKYYASSEHATGKRIAAFHYKDSTEEEWNLWPVEKKFGWYYDKTHSLINFHKNKFLKVIDIETEDMSSEKSRAALSAILDSKYLSPAVYVNKHFELDAVPVDERTWVQRYLGKLDISRLATSDFYGVSHALNEFFVRMSFRIGDGSGHNEKAVKDIVSSLNEARQAFEISIDKLNKLDDLIRKSISSAEYSRPFVSSSVEVLHLRGQLEEVNARVKLLEMDLAALYASKSWRLTSPLRWVSGRLNKLLSGNADGAR